MGHPLGLDYAGVMAVANMLEITVDHVMLRKLQILESCEMGAHKATSGDGSKPCRNAHACAMCSKHCNERIGHVK